jgi:hypothetical protein
MFFCFFEKKLHRRARERSERQWQQWLPRMTTANPDSASFEDPQNAFFPYGEIVRIKRWKGAEFLVDSLNRMQIKKENSPELLSKRLQENWNKWI